MAHGFNKNGQYDFWSDILEYNTRKQLDALERLPIPQDSQINISADGIDVTNFILELSKEISGIEENYNLSPENINILGKLLRTINSSPIKINTNLISEEDIDKVLTLVNKYNKDNSYLRKEGAIKNSIVSKIRQIISLPSNQLLATEPVDVKPLADAGDRAKEIIGFSEPRFSSWDMITSYKQQEDASIGKGDVGIGANGLKVFFALSNYYNNYYTKEVNFEKDILISPKSFLKEFTINGKTRVITSIANVDIPTKFLEDTLNIYGYNNLNKELTKLSTEKAAINASAFLTGATDNAKELVMAKINATLELASMHMYLISLGYSIEDVSIYMNSDLARYVSKQATGNIFKNTDEIFVPSIIDAYKIVNTNISQSEIDQFKDIYYGAQEFRVLASILKVNQKASANIPELNKFLSKFEGAVYSREHKVLNKHLIKLRNPDLWKIKINGGKDIIDMIIDDNPLLSKHPDARKYVEEVLLRASNIKVNYIDENGFTNSKRVSLIGGQFDFRYYIHLENSNYRAAAIEYYNLFKNTINIFDVIENSPHFREMVNGVGIIHNVMSTYSKKYNMAFNKVRDLVRLEGTRIVTNNKEVKHLFGNSALPIKISDIVLARSFRAIENFIVSGWFKSGKRVSDFRFNPKNLLSLAGIPKLTFYLNDNIKYYSIGEIKGLKNIDDIKNNIIEITPTQEEDFIIDLTTDYGIANFKIFMEEVVLKILQQSKANNILELLRLSSVKNSMGLISTQIVPSFNISSLNSPINMEKFQALLTSFNEIDSTVENGLKIKNSENKVISYKDLFYVYNLVVNNEMYGDKRLTPLFDDYIKHEDSLGREYLDFVSSVDSNRVNIFEIPELGTDTEAINLRNQLYSNQIDDILFMLFHNRGALNIDKVNYKIELKNANFILNTYMEERGRKDTAPYIALNAILSILNNKNLIVNFNCD